MWRVPKDRGASTYLAALVLKLLVKHGWPAKVQPVASNWGDGFLILHADTGEVGPADFWAAAEIAVRVVGRTYGVDFSHDPPGVVLLAGEYTVTAGGFVRRLDR